MTAAFPLVLCGTGFRSVQLAGLDRLNGRIQLVGLLAENSQTATKLAEQTQVRHWTRPEQIPSGIGGGWVSAIGHGVPAGERAADLLAREIPLLAEAPLGYDELAGCLRQARRTRTPLRLAAAVANIPAARRFLGAAQAMRTHQPAKYIAASCTRSALQALLYLLGEAIGGLRPWRFYDPVLRAEPLVVLGGSLAAVPVSLRILNKETLTPQAATEIIIGNDAGELALRGVRGPVVWTSHATGAGVLLAGPDIPGECNATIWSRAIGSELRAFTDSVGCEYADGGEVPYQLMLCQLRQDILAALGPQITPAGPPACTVAELATAAIEAAGDDLCENVMFEIPTSDETHGVGLAGLSERVADREALVTLPAAMQRLEAISLRAVLELLASSGALIAGESARSTDQIIAALGAAPRHAWLVRRWLAALTAHGIIAETAGGYRWQGSLPDVGVATDLSAAYAKLGFPAAMSEVHQLALEQLARIVRDEISIERVLFEDGEVLTKLAAYQDNIFATYLNAACGHLIRRCPQQSDQGLLRVIELGGGAGLSTAAAMRAFKGREVDYLFTDISRIFTMAAEQRFSGHTGVRYGLLDINADFAAQGVAPQAADVVLAGNALHNATNVRRTLRRIRRVLTAGGWLVFTESTRENHVILTGMQFLLSPQPGSPLLGSEDRRAGTDQVFVDIPGWNAELLAAGFLPQFTLPPPDSPLAVAGQHLFFAIAR